MCARAVTSRLSPHFWSTQLLLFTTFALPNSPQEHLHTSPPLHPWLTSWACISQQKAVVGPAARLPPFSLTHTHAPLLLFDGPINCVVFNFFGHHNPSSSKTLSCFYWREGKNNRLFLRPLFFWASSGNTGLLVMITSAVITALIFFSLFLPF